MILFSVMMLKVEADGNNRAVSGSSGLHVLMYVSITVDRVIITAAADAPLPDVPIATTTPAAPTASTPATSQTPPPLTATTPSGGGADASSQQPAKPSDAALALSVPKSLLSLAGLLVAGLALF